MSCIFFIQFGLKYPKLLPLKTWNCWQSNSILLHSGLNPAWHFWLSTRFSCCLKMKSVENILGYIREQFCRFSRGCKPRENLWNCSRKYTKMFKTDSFLGNTKIEYKPECLAWSSHYATRCFVAFFGGISTLNSGWNMKKYSVVQL